MVENAIEVKNLTKKFGSFVAVDKINFAVKKGEVFGFLGPNGAGKTTTIRMLCGLLTSSSGEGDVGGFNIDRQSEDIKKIIGYMSQKFSLYEDMTVSENIDFYAGIYRTEKKTRQEKKKVLIKKAELSGLETQLVANLSTGVRQHLALICALIHDPRIVFLDEPTAGVDPLTRRKFWELIRELARQGMTFLVTTHYMDEANLCDRLALIADGHIIACDTPAALKNNFVQEILFEIECDKVMEALEELRALKAVRDVALYGVFLHVVVEEEKTKQEIMDFLSKKKINVSRVERIAPTLEDVFVFLVEEEDRLALKGAL